MWFEDTEQDNDLKRMLRDHVHLRAEVMEYASLIVQKMGAFQYAALHIRRNELQYKNSFLAAEDSLKHVEPLLKSSEPLYIATDEKDDSFFEAMEKKYTVYRLVCGDTTYAVHCETTVSCFDSDGRTS